MITTEDTENLTQPKRGHILRVLFVICEETSAPSVVKTPITYPNT